MKKILSAFIFSTCLLSVFFVGTVYSEQPVTDDNEPAISQDASGGNESILDLLLTPDSVEAGQLEKESGQNHEVPAIQEDGLTLKESDVEENRHQDDGKSE